MNTWQGFLENGIKLIKSDVKYNYYKTPLQGVKMNYEYKKNLTLKEVAELLKKHPKAEWTNKKSGSFCFNIWKTHLREAVVAIDAISSDFEVRIPVEQKKRFSAWVTIPQYDTEGLIPAFFAESEEAAQHHRMSSIRLRVSSVVELLEDEIIVSKYDYKQTAEQEIYNGWEYLTKLHKEKLK